MAIVIPYLTVTNPSFEWTNLLFIPLLTFYFFKSRENFAPKYDGFVIVSLLGFFSTDVANFLKQYGLEGSWEFIFPPLYMLGFMYLMRIMGSRITVSCFTDILKITIPSIILFITFGFFVLDRSDTLEYLTILFGTCFTASFVVVTLFRKIKNPNYLLGSTGAILIGTSNVAYLILDVGFLPNSYKVLMIASYLFGAFLLTKVIAEQINEVANA